MFGFGKRKPHASPPGVNTFGIKTRIAKSVGKDGHYKCGSVRALPSVNPGEVVLQATDGHQAVCLLTGGQMANARLVPPGVLPVKQLAQPVGIRLSDGQWESLDGKIAADRADAGESSFPKIGDALPVVGKQPFHETTAHAQQRCKTDKAHSMHVTVGIDIDLLRKAAESLGTTKLTLFVPVPVKDSARQSREIFVDKPIAMCPANKDADSKGIAVVMPLTPENGTSHYAKLRDIVVASEQRVPKSVQSEARRAG